MKIGFGPLLGIALAAGVLVGIAFAGGAFYGRKNAPTPVQASTSSSTGAAGAAGAGGAARAAGAGGAAAGGTPGAGGGQRGGGGAGGAAAGATQGAIVSNDGTTLTLRTAAGIEQKVTISPQTQVSTVTEASQNDLAPGTVVLVQGQPGDGGTIAAGAITITSASRSAGPAPAGTPGAAGPRRGAAAAPTP